jgi:hypothetical protein
MRDISHEVFAAQTDIEKLQHQLKNQETVFSDTNVHSKRMQEMIREVNEKNQRLRYENARLNITG